MDNVIKLDFIDELKIEGVKYKGYGVLPKYVMIDPDLTIEAKGIYAYFCSYAGAGNTAFPSRDKIVANLMINKDTYYKHFNVITSQGYIMVEQKHAHGGRGNGFTKNIYTLVSNPKKFEDKPEDVKHNQAYMRIRFGGLEAAGFGFIPKAVMLDSRLSLKAKAIYAYFCSFTGSGNAAFPKATTIFHHLNISKVPYYKYFNLLLDYNYISVEQRRINGQMSINDYYLNDKPNAEIKPMRTISSDSCQTGNSSDKQDRGIVFRTHKELSPRDSFSDTQKPEDSFSDTQKPDTNINNTKTNNFNNNQSINQQAAQPPNPAEPEKIDGLIDEEYIEKIKDNLLEAGTLPYAFLSDDKKLTVAIRLITEWEIFSAENSYTGADARLRRSTYILFVEALIEMLTVQPQPMKLKGAFVIYSKVYDRLIRYLHKSGYSLYITDVQDAAIDGFISGCRNTKIRNHLQYMKACIWTALQTGSVSIDAQIKHDFG